MTSNDELLDALKDSRKKVDIALKKHLLNFTNKNITLIQAMRYGTLSNGKRLRPFLVYQIGEMFGSTNLSNLDVPASAIECIHAYSLIHDDLPTMDNDMIRRGLPSCHIKYGEGNAILAGNALQSLAFNILAEGDMPGVPLENRIKMISLLSDASGANGICLGQFLDLEMTTKSYSFFSERKLKKIYYYKTVALINAAIKMGVLVANKNNEIINSYLGKFATSIGLAFQIQDDILDIMDDNRNNDKHNGNNFKNSKITYPSLLGLNKAKTKIKDLYFKSLNVLKNIDKLGYNTRLLVALVNYIISHNEYNM